MKTAIRGINPTKALAITTHNNSVRPLNMRALLNEITIEDILSYFLGKRINDFDSYEPLNYKEKTLYEKIYEWLMKYEL